MVRILCFLLEPHIYMKMGEQYGTKRKDIETS